MSLVLEQATDLETRCDERHSNRTAASGTADWTDHLIDLQKVIRRHTILWMQSSFHDSFISAAEYLAQVRQLKMWTWLWNYLWVLCFSRSSAWDPVVCVETVLVNHHLSWEPGHFTVGSLALHLFWRVCSEQNRRQIMPRHWGTEDSRQRRQTTCQCLHLSEQKTSRIYCTDRRHNGRYQRGRGNVFSGDFCFFFFYAFQHKDLTRLTATLQVLHLASMVLYAWTSQNPWGFYG